MFERRRGFAFIEKGDALGSGKIAYGEIEVTKSSAARCVLAGRELGCVLAE